MKNLSRSTISLINEKLSTAQLNAIPASSRQIDWVVLEADNKMLWYSDGTRWLSLDLQGFPTPNSASLANSTTLESSWLTRGYNLWLESFTLSLRLGAAVNPTGANSEINSNTEFFTFELRLLANTSIALPGSPTFSIQGITATNAASVNTNPIPINQFQSVNYNTYAPTNPHGFVMVVTKSTGTLSVNRVSYRVNYRFARP